MQDYYSFPKNFLWGVATASYQVEGAAKDDGRGPSVWDTFSHAPGNTASDHTGDVACDQYHLYRDDVKLMKSLGAKAYRFSVSWSRVFPQGYGKVNEKGIAYYERLVDALLEAGIQPWMTLFHWDLPQAIEDKFGGWRSRDTARHFADYAAFMTKRLSDRVRNYFTINEFFCFTDKSYATPPGGEAFAPGVYLSNAGRNQVRHHAVLGHGMAVQAIRANARKPASIGLAENAAVFAPVVETQENIAAARKAMRECNGHFLTAVMEGKYPDTYLKGQGADAPRFTDEDMKIIGSPLDFVGLNAYTPSYVRATETTPGYEILPMPESYPRMVMPWLFIGPQVVYWGPRLISDLWKVKAVYITENGCAALDKLTPRKEVLDTDRVMFLRNHFIAAHRAVSEGVPLKGYFVWSLLDNFEWCFGYTRRFGIVYTNYETQERTPKMSAQFYKEVIRRNAVV